MDDGRWLVLGIVGTLAAATTALHGSAVRVGPRLQPRTAPLSKTDPFPTGLANLDEALGTRDDKEQIGRTAWPKIAGWPRARLAELYGPTAGILETLMFQSIAASQSRGATVAFIDATHTLDTSYAKALGVDLEHLLVAQPDSVEQAFEVILTLARSGAVDLIVADRLGLAKRDDEDVGASARVWSKNMRTLTSIADQKGTTVLFVNPLVTRPGALDPADLTGAGGSGNALKFYASIRVEGRKIDTDLVQFKVVKNKLAPPFRSVNARIVLGCGLVPAPDEQTGSGSTVRVGPRLRPSTSMLPEITYTPRRRGQTEAITTIARAERFAKGTLHRLQNRIVVVPRRAFVKGKTPGETPTRTGGTVRVKVLGFWRWEWYPSVDEPFELHTSFMVVAEDDASTAYELDGKRYQIRSPGSDRPGPAPATVSTSSRHTPPRGSPVRVGPRLRARGDGLPDNPILPPRIAPADTGDLRHATLAVPSDPALIAWQYHDHPKQEEMPWTLTWAPAKDSWAPAKDKRIRYRILPSPSPFYADFLRWSPAAGGGYEAFGITSDGHHSLHGGSGSTHATLQDAVRSVRLHALRQLAPSNDWVDNQWITPLATYRIHGGNVHVSHSGDTWTELRTDGTTVPSDLGRKAGFGMTVEAAIQAAQIHYDHLIDYWSRR